MQVLKRAMTVIGVVALFFLLGRGAYAADAAARITVSEVEGGYIATGGELELREEKLSVLIAKICEERERAQIYFDAVHSSEDIFLRAGEYILGGSLSLSASLSLSGVGNTVFRDFSLTLTGASVRLKEGHLLFENSVVTASGAPAFLMDYNSSTVFEMHSGEISARGADCAVHISLGSFIASGGKVTSDGDSAIYNSATLALGGDVEVMGARYGCVTEKPIILSVEGKPMSGTLSVKYLSEFERGRASKVFYRAEEGSRVTLFDINDKEQALKYFADADFTDEENFLAVYLPFRVRLVSGDNEITSEEVLYGDLLTRPKNPVRVGYDFIGWYLGDDEYSFSSPVTDDVELRARFSLSAPSFLLSSLFFTFDASAHQFTFDSISHPLAESGFFGYEWYKDGELLDISSDSLSITYVSQSGDYYCKLKFSYLNDFVEVTTPSVRIEVAKKNIPIPSAEPRSYSGEMQTSGLVSNAVYTVDESGGVSVGSYPVTLRLVDGENCTWQGQDTDVAVIDFKILKAENYWTYSPSISDTYEGLSLNPVASSRFGSVRFLFSASIDGEYTEAPYLTVGVYYMIAEVLSSDNYDALRSEPIAFAVRAEVVSGIRVYTLPKKTEYVAFDEFESEGLSVIVSYNSGRAAEIGEEEMAVIYQRSDRLLFGDTAVTVAYSGVYTSVPITVQKAHYDISALTFSDIELVYDGGLHAPSLFGVLPTGLDGIALSAELSAEYSDVGEYSVYLVFSSESDNYYTPSPIAARLRILPRALTAVWEGAGFVYDGTAKCPTATAVLADGTVAALAVAGAKVGAGEYTAVACAPSANYIIENPSFAFSIAKATYDMSNARWESEDFVYDGTVKSVYVTGLPIGVSALGYANASASDAGEYIASVTLSYDSRNYNAPTMDSFRWEIAKAEYDMSGFDFTSFEAVYDGGEHFPSIGGALPVGKDGSSPSYTMSGGAVNVDDGVVWVILTFTSTSKNYNSPASMSAAVRILPLEIEVSWGALSFVYNGEEHLPSAYAEECMLSVSGAGVNAGQYVATAAPVSNNYVLKNPTVSFTVAKASNIFTLPLTVSDVYTSGTVSPYAEALIGAVEYRYYSDASLGEEIDMPRDSGEYYVVALVAELDNYLELRSEAVSFRIMAVEPVGIRCDGVVDCVALSRISPAALVVYLCYNDGTVSRLNADNISVIYPRDEGVWYGDTSVIVSYGDFTAPCEVNVARADYDMSGVFWSESEFVYDGSEKTVNVFGLPEGVKVIGYENNGAINAGSYTVVAILSYDSLNFNTPPTVSAVLNVAKCPVSIPEKISTVYDGEAKTVDFCTDDSLFYAAEQIVKTNAGVYRVPLELHDEHNYEWQSGDGEAFGIFEILPRTLEIEIEGASVYLFEGIPEVGYKMTGGSIIEGDRVNIVIVASGERFVAAADNPNYLINSSGGVIEYKNTLSPTALSYLMLALLLIVVLVLCIVALSSERIRARFSFVRRKSAPIALGVKELAPQPSPAPTANVPPVETPVEVAESIMEMDAERADSLISDTLAKELVHYEENVVETEGTRKSIVNVDTLSENFLDGERVDVNRLKEKKLVSSDTGYVKVLARGAINKSLFVYANDFSMSAVKMIALTGGEAIKCVSARKYKARRKKKGGGT